MSKRHHASRRKAYGRRQHELHERMDRRRPTEHIDLGWDQPDGATSPLESFSFLEPRAPRLRFALGD